MKGLLIDVHNAKIQEVEVSELDDYYKWIGCEIGRASCRERV